MGRVARLAGDAGEVAGLDAGAVRQLRRAGLVHDVSNAIWDKRGRLTHAEWERVRLHPHYSERVLCATLALLEPLLGFAVAPATARFVLGTAAESYRRLGQGDAEGAIDGWLEAAFDPGYRELLERASRAPWARPWRTPSRRSGSRCRRSRHGRAAPTTSAGSPGRRWRSAAPTAAGPASWPGARAEAG
jgi:hypothetical protein